MYHVCLRHVSQVDPLFMTFPGSLESSDVNNRPIDPNSQDYSIWFNIAGCRHQVLQSCCSWSQDQERQRQRRRINLSSLRCESNPLMIAFTVLQFRTWAQETRFKTTLLGCRNLKKFFEKKSEDEDTSAPGAKRDKHETTKKEKKPETSKKEKKIRKGNLRKLRQLRSRRNANIVPTDLTFWVWIKRSYAIVRAWGGSWRALGSFLNQRSRVAPYLDMIANIDKHLTGIFSFAKVGC